MIRYRANKLDCDVCSLKPRCCPNTPARKVPRSIHEGARDMARDIAATDAYATSCRERKKIDIDQTWRLSRICWWGKAWRPPVPRRRGRAHRFQGGDDFSVGLHQLGPAAASRHEAAG